MFSNPRTTFENTPVCAPKYSIVQGVGWFPKIFFDFTPNIFVSLKPMQDFGTLQQPLLGELVMSRKRERREEAQGQRTHFFWTNTFLPAAQEQRMHSARTNTFRTAAQGPRTHSARTKILES